jgi:putative cardiolipin synthase
MRNLRDAALRGVRVRLLVDDLYTAGGDPMFRGLAAFPNVEVRLFNPFCCARESIASKYIASIADFRRLNHRMHNKLYIADGAVAVMGGRNIADEYFTRSATSNFVDMDVFVVGPSPVNSPAFSTFTGTARRPIRWRPSSANPQTGKRRDAVLTIWSTTASKMMSVVVPPFDILGYGPISDDLESGRLWPVWGTAVVADQPTKVMATSGRNGAIDECTDECRGSGHGIEERGCHFLSVFHSGVDGREGIWRLRKRNVTVAILTTRWRQTTSRWCIRVRALPRGIAANRRRPHELSPTRIQHNERLKLPGASLAVCTPRRQ